MKKNNFFLAFVLVFATMTSFAQNDVVGIPYTFSHTGISYSVDKVDLPTVNKEALLAEDAQNIKNGVPFRFGTVQHVSYNFNNSGRTDILPNGAKLWRLTLHSPEAVSMAVFFSTFNIPKGATMHVYSGDRSEVGGTYSNEDVQPNGVMSSDFIHGDEITLEYYEPADALFHGNIEIDRVSHVYRNIDEMNDDPKGEVDDAQDCYYHAVCPEGAEWRNQIRSVVRISITGETGSYFCSGALINNVRMDKTPYVLTANHCLDGLNCAFTFYFFYQFTNCDGTGVTPVKKLIGGEIKAYISENANTGINTSSDFLLLLITKDLASKTWSDSCYFAGWDATGQSSAGLAIHHPAGAYKRFSFPRLVNTSSSYNKFWQVAWYTNPNKGCTEQGSSGSPLFNQNKAIIGDLSFGSSSCNEPYGKDYYGKLSYSWTNNNNSNNNKKLKPWLDPDNTGTLALPGMMFNGTVDVNTYSSTPRIFSIVPNPTTGNITIQGSFDNTTSGIYNVYDAMGKLVRTGNLQLESSVRMDFNDLNNGIYLLEIIGGEQVYHSKMIISK